MPWKPKKDKGPLQIERSKASILYDKEGRTYIDCISGVSHGKLKEEKYFLISMNKNSLLAANYTNNYAFYQIILVGHAHPKIVSTFHQQLGTVGTGMISTTPEPIWHKLRENKAGRNGIPSEETENLNRFAKVDDHIPVKPKSRLVNRLLSTLNLPDTLETALAFSSG